MKNIKLMNLELEEKLINLFKKIKTVMKILKKITRMDILKYILL